MGGRRKLKKPLDKTLNLCYSIPTMNDEYENNYELHIAYSDETPAEAEVIDKKTLKLLDQVCQGIEVPSDEECEAAFNAHH